MTLEFDSSNAYLPYSPQVLSVLKKVMYWQPEGYFFSEAYKSGKWDGKYYLVSKAGNRIAFPTGLLSLAIQALRGAGIEVNSVDKRDFSFERKELSWIGVDLRDYQEEAKEAAIKATRGIWANATGSGKMLLAASFAQKIGGKTTIAVLTKEALSNTADELQASIGGCGIGRWGGGKKTTDWITVTTHKSFSQAFSKESELSEHVQSSSVVIFDEVHHAAADSFYKAMMRSSAIYKIGMSGTPFRGDKKDLKIMAATGRRIYDLPTTELQERGFAIKAKITFVNSEAPDHLPYGSLLRLDAQSLYKEGVMFNMRRNRKAIELAKKHSEDGHIVLLTVERAEHGQLISRLTGWPYVDGKSKTDEREEIQRQFTDGEIPVLVASRIYNQSANFPKLSVLINLAGFSPQAAIIQKLGRIIRTSAGKEEAFFYDFYDNWEDKLRNHSDRRISHLRKEGHEVAVV